MSVKKVMVSNNNVWIIPSVMRMTDQQDIRELLENLGSKVSMLAEENREKMEDNGQNEDA